MYAVRRWATCNARSLERLYKVLASAFETLDPLWCRIGVQRLEKPFAATEAWVKGLLFDCQMCGRCVLSETGMTCPANCPKSLRNGPCGGVRGNGHCEIDPGMRCVWLEAWEGAMRMRNGQAIYHPLPQQDHSIEGSSAWMRLVAESAALCIEEDKAMTDATEPPS